MELHPRAGTDLTPDHDGPPDAIRNDSRVIAAYPGRDDEANERIDEQPVQLPDLSDDLSSTNSPTRLNREAAAVATAGDGGRL